jgi:hypothetical protein
MGIQASASSSLDFGVEAFQFRAGVLDAKLPIDTALLGVGLVGPHADCGLQFGQLSDTLSMGASNPATYGRFKTSQGLGVHYPSFFLS